MSKIRQTLRNLNLKDRPHDQFQILERLGKGSFGAVYKAVHWSTGTIVAIKKCMTEDIEESKQEIEMMRHCDNDEIVRFYGCYFHEGMFWIVMEYCALGSLSDVLTLTKRTTLSEAQAASLCKSMLNALKYMHNKKLMHRDIKPENLLMTDTAEAKLADFGVAGKFSKNDKRTTLTGTPYYIAPEILQEDCTGYDENADIWSLGITAIEFVEGEPPHYHIPPMRVMIHIATAPPPTLSNPNKWSKDFVDFIAKCLIKDPKKRPSAKQMLKHPWMKNAKSPKVTLGAVVEDAMKVVESCGGLEAALAKFKPRGSDDEDEEYSDDEPDPEVAGLANQLKSQDMKNTNTQMNKSNSPYNNGNVGNVYSPPTDTGGSIRGSKHSSSERKNTSRGSISMFGGKKKEEKEMKKQIMNALFTDNI